ncbi:L-rhamnose mutarotase [Niastella koreensis]|uniref:L-rhamnose mutarotase n=1 Tax=Niastella koreensis TaxID=354356 RepID=UPI001F617EAF|nr:L-rhamnose mutarotase [Niastella koreensis]
MLPILLVMQGCLQQSAARDSEKKQRVRYGMITGVKPEKLDYYKSLHGKPWATVLAKIKECNIENYSIYLQKIDSNYFLFSYFEYTGNDFDADMKKMAADTATQRWWRETDPCQLPLLEAVAKKQIWTKMEEVFYNK